MAVTQGFLPAGVAVRELVPHGDERGSFVELWREDWGVSRPAPQWNAVQSAAGVLRGVHVHIRHDDYLTVPFGRALIGVRDLRVGSPTFGAVATVEAGDTSPTAFTIPRGVAHGFLFLQPSVHCYAVSRYFDPADELGCRFDDADLDIPWPITDPVLSPRDHDLGSFAELLQQLAPHQAALVSRTIAGSVPVN